MEYNLNSIKSTTLTETVYPYCPLGKDNYEAQITVTGKGQKNFLDYIDATEFMCNLSGKELIIEQVADMVKEFFSDFYEDVDVEVSAKSRKHCPVIVKV